METHISKIRSVTPTQSNSSNLGLFCERAERNWPLFNRLRIVGADAGVSLMHCLRLGFSQEPQVIYFFPSTLLAFE